MSSFEADRIAAMLRAYGPLAPIAFVVARVLGAVVFLPGSVMAIGAGVLFGPLWGAVYNLLGATGGAVLAFGVARFIAPNLVAEKVGRDGALARLVQGVEAEGWRFVAFVRLVPLFPYNLLNYALGLTRIKLSHYTLATLVCMIPADIAYVYLGHAGREAASGSAQAVRSGLLALGLLAALAFLPRLVRAFSGRARAEPRSAASGNSGK